MKLTLSMILMLLALLLGALLLGGCVGAWGPDVPRPVIVNPEPSVVVVPVYPVYPVYRPYYYWRRW